MFLFLFLSLYGVACQSPAEICVTFHDHRSGATTLDVSIDGQVTSYVFSPHQNKQCTSIYVGPPATDLTLLPQHQFTFLEGASIIWSDGQQRSFEPQVGGWRLQ